MYAIIKTGGKQFKVTAGEAIDVELPKGLEPGTAIEFSEVLFVYDGQAHQVGAPFIDGFSVKGEVVCETFGPKVQGVKYQPRKRQRRKFGHRQHYSRIKINEIAKI